VSRRAARVGVAVRVITELVSRPPSETGNTVNASKTDYRVLESWLGQSNRIQFNGGVIIAGLVPAPVVPRLQSRHGRTR
jgi:hypothetical protein